MRKQILIVEDNEINREILSEILSCDYQVLEAGNGQEALDILQECKETISLILLDIMMPVMDGYTFLSIIKEDAELSLIPVIVMTQEDSEDDEIAALAHGATDFVPKPYRPQVILHRVASLIKLRETAAMVNQFKYDRLTGLYSKEYFFQQARELLMQYPEREYSLICLNLENFKLYNDVHGVLEGDRLLIEIGAFFQKLMGHGAICGRYRADRFICLQEQNREYKHRIATGQDGRYACVIEGKNVAMKWGIYEVTDRSVPVELMCDRAILAVNSIKGQYNQYYAVYDDSHRNRLLREQAITSSMETALAEKQFVVYYQPKYSLSEDCISGAEALVRWIHPEFGFMPPAEFIPLFEKNGFIPKLDWYIWDRVCAQLRDWKDRGLPLIPISVNVSRADMYQTHLADGIQALVQKYDIDPMYLHLEITESAYSEHPEQIISTVKQFRQKGFIVEMDDFGSGYSSLNMLSEIKLDVLKLDTGFVRNETNKSSAQSILNDVVVMAHRLNLSVVAEGVETREQLNRLRAVGCDYAQGYFFAKPLPTPEFEKLLVSYHPRTSHSAEAHRDLSEAHRLLVIDEDSLYRAKLRSTLDEQYSVIEASDAESALTCIHAQSAQGISAVIVSMTLPEDGAALVLKTLRQEPGFWQIPVLATVPSGERIQEFPLIKEADDYLCKCHPFFDLNKRIQRLVDIETFQLRERALTDEANRDHLTGLLNRRGFQAAIAPLREENIPLAIYAFDLDSLKRANDTFGHDEGDRLLCAFADVLRNQTRSDDIQCRYGGDEFLLVIKQISSVETILRKGENICRALQEYHLPDGTPARCSGGIAVCGADEEFSQKFIQRADAALYRAKENFKGSCCLWDEDCK